MAKKFDKYAVQTKVKDSAYPSRFGSHKSMIVESETEKLNDSDKVVCEDEYGYYITDRSKLDNGLTDMNRALRIEKRNEKLAEYSIENIKKSED